MTLALAAPGQVTGPDAADHDHHRRSDSPTSDGGGSPMPATTLSRVESTLGTGLGDVRVHDDAGAASAAASHSARAFTYGSHIFLGAGEQATDVGLMAHESAHVIQQRSGAAIQRSAFGTLPTTTSRVGAEREAAGAALAATTGSSYTVTGVAPAGQPQYAEEGEGWVERQIWDLLEGAAPNLVPIIRRGVTGVVDWIGDRISAAVETVVDTVMAPVRTISGAGAWLHGQFGPLITWVQEAASRIAANDCGPITEAAQKLDDAATRFITPIVEKVQGVATKVGGFLHGLWDKFGAPAWDFVRQYAGQQWDRLKQLGEWIWDKTAPVRRLAARAWTWLKNKIGIGEGPEGQNGILQWIQGKVSTAWDWIQQKIAPYKRQIQTVLAVMAGIAVLFSPAGPVILVGGAVVGVIQGIRWIRANLGNGNAIVRARTYVERQLIPQLMGAISRMTTAVTRLANGFSSALGAFASGLGALVGAATSTALSFLVRAAQWLADRAVELASWATQKLTALATGMVNAFNRLLAFLRPVLAFLGRVGSLLIDIYGLPLLLAGSIWNRIPRCIRDPFVDWIIPLILRQVEIFRELVSTPEAWVKTKADVMNIVRLIFVTKSLRGAMRAVFDLILRVFAVPRDLLVKVVQKVQVAWDVVIRAPIKFLKNMVRTIGRGLQLYAANLKDNLAKGLETWLFRDLLERGVSPPGSWTNPWDVAGFVLDVAGLSMNHVFDLMKKVPISEGIVERLRAGYRYISKAWGWIREMQGKSPQEVTAAIKDGAKEFAKGILEQVVIYIVERVAAYIALRATAAAASVGISELLEAAREIYNGIAVAVRWMKQILEMVDRALEGVIQIAAGALEPAAGVLTDALKRGTPVVIGFLAAQVGLGGIPAKLAEIVDSLREKVDAAILAVLRAVKGILTTVAGTVREAVGAILEWWRMRERITVDGETHTLSFAGPEDAPELMIESSPTRLRDYLADTPASAPVRAGIKKRIDTYETLRTERRAAKVANDATKLKAKDLAIRDEFMAIRADLTALLAGDKKYGSRDEPIPISWPGPATSSYPVLYFGGRLGKRTRLQSTMKDRVGETDETGVKISAYRPHAPRALAGGEVIGLGSAFYLSNNTIVGPLTGETTGGGGKLGTILSQYGFAGDSEGLDLDHVHEVQFGGRAINDVVANLWPLDSSKNRSKGSTLAQAAVTYPKEPAVTTSIPALKALLKARNRKGPFWFKVTKLSG